MGIVIKNGICVLNDSEQKLDLLLENGKIAASAQILPTSGHEVYDASDCYIFPGFIDAHTHLQTSSASFDTADDFKTGTAAALAGGTTCIIDYATQEKGKTLAAALDAWNIKAANVSSCDYAFHITITDFNKNTAAEIAQMAEKGVTSFRIYMTGDNLRCSDADIFDALCAISKIHGILSVHCENGDLVNSLIKHEKSRGHFSTRFHAVSHPDYIEAEAINRFCAIGRAAACPIHIVNLSTKLGLEEARKARSIGQKLYIETCVQYLMLDESLYLMPGAEGTKYVCTPPLRSRIDISALWEGLACAEIQSIASDHCSFNFNGQKDSGKYNFSAVPNGLPSIEHRCSIVLSEGVRRGLSLSQISALLSSNAAKLFGLENKGKIEPGADADLVVWSPSEDVVISAQDMVQNVDYTPYDGVKIKGKIRGVFLNGILSAENGKPTITSSGKYVSRIQSDYF